MTEELRRELDELSRVVDALSHNAHDRNDPGRIAKVRAEIETIQSVQLAQIQLIIMIGERLLKLEEVVYGPSQDIHDQIRHLRDYLAVQLWRNNGD